MSRTAVAYTNTVANGSVALPAGTAVVAGAGNGGQIARAVAEKTLLIVKNASGGSGTAKVLAGANPPAIAAGQGDMSAATIADGAYGVLGPFESGRFIQADGSMLIETSVAMSVVALFLTRRT